MPTLDVQGIRIHYEEAGGARERAGAPALLLHGWGASWKFWQAMLTPLSSQYRCVAVDLPGFGESDKPAVPYTIEWYAEFVGRLLDALGWPKAALCGHSMGGMISSLFAARHPERVERLVLVNAPVVGRQSLSLKSRIMLWPFFRWLMWIFMHVGFVRRWVAKDFTYEVRLPSDVVDDVIRATYRSSLGSVLSIRDTDVSPHLRSIQAPTLVLGTDRDAVISPSQHALAAREIPGARHVVLRDVGHCPMFERPAEFSRPIEEFLLARPAQAALDPAAAPR